MFRNVTVLYCFYLLFLPYLLGEKDWSIGVFASKGKGQDYYKIATIPREPPCVCVPGFFSSWG